MVIIIHITIIIMITTPLLFCTPEFIMKILFDLHSTNDDINTLLFIIIIMHLLYCTYALIIKFITVNPNRKESKLKNG